MDNSFRKPRRREYLSLDEIERLLAASKTFSRNPQRDYCLLLLMFRHGLRISELTSLKLSDVNLELRGLHVRRCKGSDGGPHPLFNGETGAIAAWLVERAKLNPPAGCETLFISERRKPLSRVTARLMVRQIAAAAGLEHLEIHLHMLRHSCGYTLVNRGTDIRVIQAFLGHRSITSTTRYAALDSKRFAKLF